MRRQHKRDGFMVGVQQHQQRFIHDAVAAFVAFLYRIAGEPQAYASYFRIAPVLFGHFLSVGPEPREILDFGAADFAPLEKPAAPENWVKVK